MGIIEIYLAIGIVVAIFVLIGITADGFDEEVEERFGLVITIYHKMFVIAFTILIWPYTLYRIIKMSIAE
jgi:hypothetical protein